MLPSRRVARSPNAVLVDQMQVACLQLVEDGEGCGADEDVIKVARTSGTRIGDTFRFNQLDPPRLSF